MVIPCKECLKFPVCISKREVRCKDLFIHIHTVHFTTRGYSSTTVDLTGQKVNADEYMKVQKLFKRSIADRARTNGYRIFFSSRKGE